MNELQSRVQIEKWFSSSSCVKESALPDTFPKKAAVYRVVFLSKPPLESDNTSHCIIPV